MPTPTRDSSLIFLPSLSQSLTSFRRLDKSHLVFIVAIIPRYLAACQSM